MEKRGLGRGLEALIPANAEKKERGIDLISNIPSSKFQSGIVNIPIDIIKVNRYQPREEFDESALQELSSSIKEKGFIQPLLVRSQDEEYELITGERRFKAAMIAGLTEVPCIIKDISDLDSLQLSIIENVQRENLNPIDQARAYNRLTEEFGMNQEDVAETIGKDRKTVANILRLLKLPKKIQEAVSRGTVSMGHARAMLSLTSTSEQMALCNRVIKKGISVREAERYVKKSQDRAGKPVLQKDPNLAAIEQDLRDAFGTKVKIIKAKKGGRIEIEFYSDADLERIVTRLK